jgi:hypothetical protein
MNRKGFGRNHPYTDLTHYPSVWLQGLRGTGNRHPLNTICVTVRADLLAKRRQEDKREDRRCVGRRSEGRGHEGIRIIAKQERSVRSGGLKVRVLCNRFSRHGDASGNIWAPMPTQRPACASQHNKVLVRWWRCNERRQISTKLCLLIFLSGLVVRVPGNRMEMYCDSCEVRTEFIYVMLKKVDRLCGLVVRVPGYTTEMYCDSCEVRTEFIYVM